jgi:hypothetical protein
MTAKEVSLKPVSGWTTGTLPKGNVLLTMEYVTAPADLLTGKRQETTFALTNAQCAELAQTLLRKAALSRARGTDAPPSGRTS